MKEIKVKLLDKTTLELLEDATKGDQIKLDKLSDIQLDLSEIENKIQTGKDEQYQKLLEKELGNKEEQNLLKIKSLEVEINAKKQEELLKKEQEIDMLKTKLDNNIKTKELELKMAYDKKIYELEEKLQTVQSNNKLVLENEKNKLLLDSNKEKDSLNAKIIVQKQEIDMLKDFKLKQSTKMVGENLEQHCEIMYNQIGRTAFPNAEFYKDNDAKTGSKGDFIYKETDESGIELLSIMFEMKNEQDTTATKHKNKDFFKELDKDRKEKGCEYAVLVTMLEQDNELYNDITKVWEYENMYVVRPQHFISIINLLRIGAVKSYQYKLELEKVKNTNVDIMNFESNLEVFKNDFGRNYRLASDKFKTAIDEIDKSIDHLNKIKSNLLGSENNLRLANNKLEDLSLTKLGKDNPTINNLINENLDNN